MSSTRERNPERPPEGWDYTKGAPNGWERVALENRFPHQLLPGEWLVGGFPGIVIRKKDNLGDPEKEQPTR